MSAPAGMGGSMGDLYGGSQGDSGIPSMSSLGAAPGAPSMSSPIPSMSSLLHNSGTTVDAGSAVASGLRYPTVTAQEARSVAMANMVPAADSESGARKLEAAKQAALEIQASLNEPSRAAEPPPKSSGQMQMGVCIHWNCRGFGILRSQSSGEVFVHVKALQNCEELVVGD